MRVDCLKHFKQLLKVLNGIGSQLEASCSPQYLLTDRFVVPYMPSDLQVPVIAEVIEYLPAKLAFHFLYELLHEEFERFEVDALDCFGLIVIFVDYYLLESGNMSLLEVLIKHFFLQVDQILVIHDAITVCIANAEYS